MHLSHIQSHLPWTVPYSWEFRHSLIDNEFRQTSHDILHIVKSVGRIASVCEKSDHDTHSAKAQIPSLGKELASIVMSAMHIASSHGINLEGEIQMLVFEKNGVHIPNEN